VKYSDFIDQLKKKEIYQDTSYTIRTGPDKDDKIELSSIYVITDGGYLEWSSMISAFPPSPIETMYKFSDWIGSIRKDVECFFGILKKRFRYLKCPIMLHQQADIDNVYITCCIIHNMILSHDGLDRLWEDEASWNRCDREEENEEEDDDDEQIYIPVVHDPLTFQPLYIHDLISLNDVAPYEDPDKIAHYKLKCMLANHLQIMYREGKLRWPKHRKQVDSDRLVNVVVRENQPGAGDLH
jgi:hypothetical protein